MNRPRQHLNRASREQLLLRVLDEPAIKLHASRPLRERWGLIPEQGLVDGFAGRGELFQEPKNRDVFSKRLGECIAAFVLFAVTLSWLLA